MTFAKSLAPMLLGALCLVACRAGGDAASTSGQAAQPALTVHTVHAQQGQVPHTLTASGNLAAWQEVVVGAQSHGLRITQLHANVGDWVKKGQVLAGFAPESVQADVLQARASLLEAQAQAADARTNAARARSMEGTGALSQQHIDQLHTAAKAASARVQAARAALSSQLLRQSYTRVLAPDDGVISARSATVGAVVPSGTELFRMVRQGRLEWRAEVTDADVGRVHVGDAAQVRLAGGTVLYGTVRAIAPTLDVHKRVALVYVDVPAAWQRGAKAGMYVTGQFTLGQRSGWMVPHTAVVARDGFDFVFAVQADGRVQQRKVLVGARHGEKVLLLDGVDASHALVASGGGFLNDGDMVRVVDAAEVEEAAPAGSGAPAASAASSAPTL